MGQTLAVRVVGRLVGQQKCFSCGKNPYREVTYKIVCTLYHCTACTVEKLRKIKFFFHGNKPYSGTAVRGTSFKSKGIINRLLFRCLGGLGGQQGLRCIVTDPRIL